MPDIRLCEWLVWFATPRSRGRFATQEFFEKSSKTVSEAARGWQFTRCRVFAEEQTALGDLDRRQKIAAWMSLGGKELLKDHR